MAGFHEPQNENEVAGQLRYERVTSPYERFMEEEGVPIYRNSIGAYDVRDLTLGPWRRMGGRGSFIYLLGTTGRGMYVVEVPSAGALNAEHHIYEEMFYVVEGRGSTEVWSDGGGKRQAFEWQPGSLFCIPVNTSHRLVNATSSPALLIGVTTAPTLMNQFNNRRFIFDNSFGFTDRYDEDEAFFNPNLELVPHPVTGRAMVRSNIIPDIARCELPLDNQRSPGYRRIQPQMAGNQALQCFVGEHGQGRYAKAHRGESSAGTAAALICVRGKGYTFTWPHELGIHPWEDGHGDKVLRQDYVAGGMVCSSPIGPGFFHAHYGVGKEPMRFLALLGPNLFGDQGRRGKGDKDQKMTVSPNADIRDGGLTIGYDIEDPFVRKTFEQELSKVGIECRMPESLYQPRSA
jgi:mannose-6-phosphate isomerase-like protein (cupin superfamily)